MYTNKPNPLLTEQRLFNYLPAQFPKCFFSSIIIDNFSPSSASGSSTHHPSGLPLNIKVSPIQQLLLRIAWSTTFQFVTIILIAYVTISVAAVSAEFLSLLQLNDLWLDLPWILYLNDTHLNSFHASSDSLAAKLDRPRSTPLIRASAHE